MRLPGTFLNQSSDTKIKVKIGQNLKIKSTVKGLRRKISGVYTTNSLVTLYHFKSYSLKWVKGCLTDCGLHAPASFLFRQVNLI